MVATARARFDHEAAKRILREKYEAKLTFAYAGGMFRASPEMITFLSLYGDEEVVIKDLYDNPILVASGKLLEKMKMHYREQTTAWLNEWYQLTRTK